RRAALVKGGHLAAPMENDATDVLFDGREFHIFRAPKVATRNTHGTGCTLSSAIAAMLARGCEIPEAVARAKQYLSETLQTDPDIGRAAGPLNHFRQDLQTLSGWRELTFSANPEKSCKSHL